MAEDYFETVKYNIYLKKLSDMACELQVFDICANILKDVRFPIWSGSSKPLQHHYGKGGLLKHTIEVVELCLLNNKQLKTNIDEKKLFLAAFFHDVGKMWDYEPFTCFILPDKKPVLNYDIWKGTQHKRRIHHISRSAIEWNKAANENHLKESDIDEITHAILAHHGLREYGSPVAPNTKMAWMLHLCDGISARMDDAERWDGIKDK